jgi:tetratricopeptide (TPR) repeat protein
MAGHMKFLRTLTGRGSVRCLIAVLMVAVTSTACVSGNEGAAAEKIVIRPGPSIMGNFLAGRHAQAQRRISTALEFLTAILETDPDNESLLRRAFILTALEGRITEAADLVHRMVAARSDGANGRNPIADVTLVVADIKAGRFAEAEKRVGEFPENGLNVFLTPLLGAWIKVGLGNTDEALVALAALKKNDGFKAMYDLHAAIINEMAGRTDAAEEHYLNAADTQAGLSMRLIELLGGLYERAGKPDKARAAYLMYLEQHPNSQLLEPAMNRLDGGGGAVQSVKTAANGTAEALFGVASSIRRQNAQDTALIFANMALFLRPDFPLAQILVADILESDDRLEKANAVYASINTESPVSWSARLRIASNLDRLDRPEEAERQLRAMAAEKPESTEPFNDLGDILRGRERFADAVLAYDQAIARIASMDRRHWSLLYARGIALERSKQWPRAEADFLKALEFEPEQPYVLNYLGYSWVDQGLHLDEAQEMIKKAVKLRPNDGYIVDSLGWVYFRLGAFEDAARELERAVELRPDDPVINDHLGDAYWKVDRRQEARFQWRRSLSLDPDPTLKESIEGKLRDGLLDEKRKAAGND